MIIVKNLV